MEYVGDANKHLKKQVATLQQYLLQVLDHSEVELRDHEINERIWKKEKAQLLAQIKILKNGGKVEDLHYHKDNKIDEARNSSMGISQLELETSIIHLTNERDSLKETVNMLQAKLGIPTESIIVGCTRKEKEHTAEYSRLDTYGKGSNKKFIDEEKEIDDEKVHENEKKISNVNDEVIMQRIIDENTELNNKIQLYDKQLEDAKVAVLKAAEVIKELNKNIDYERKEKEKYIKACEKLQKNSNN